MKNKTRKKRMERQIVELLRSGISKRQITVRLKIGKRRVNEVYKMALELDYLNQDKPLPSFSEHLFPDKPDGRANKRSQVDAALMDRKAWIEEKVLLGWTPITIFEQLADVKISKAGFYRFLERNKLIKSTNQKRVVPEIIHKPGECLQLDWGKVADVWDSERGLKRVLWAFVGVLGHSRYLMVRLVWSNSTGETLEAMQHMLQELGGVPARITSDNPKCFAIKACKYDPILNPAFERFGAHYGITLECLPPADPQKKGKVERAMPYVRRLLEPLGEWKGLEHAQLFLNKQLELANSRTHGTTGKQPIVVFTAIEADALKPLPVLAYDPETILTVKVNRDGHIRFDHKYYSTPQEYIGQQVMVIASSTTIAIYQNGKLIDTHFKLSRNDNQSKSTKMSHRKACEQNMEDHEELLRRALLVGSHCFALITKLLQVNVGYIALRKTWGVLSLDKTYSHALIDQACKIALEHDQKGYQAVRKILETGLSNSSTELENKPTEAKILKFVRPMSVYKERVNPLLSTKKGN